MKKAYADMDPLEEIRAIREEISREFKSLRDLGSYLRENSPSANALTKSSRGSRAVGRAAKSRKAKITTKPARQRKTTKRLTPA